jgi:hypothetical protein
VIVILASRFDKEAAELVTNLGVSAAILSAEDLSSKGWRWRLGHETDGRAVVGGRRVATRDITAVLTRRPAIMAEELAHIVPTDRVYVAAEMTAFLVAWLHGLPCRVVNRPSAGNLGGPAWDRATWLVVAARLGIPVDLSPRRVPFEVESEPDTGSDDIMLTVIGPHCFGTDDTHLTRHALRLAQASSVRVLGLRFTRSEGRLRQVTVFPPLHQPEFVDPLLQCLVA